MKIDSLLFFSVLAGCGLALQPNLQAQAQPVPPDHAERMTKGLELFRSSVGAILNEHCLKCHGGEKTKGDFDLATREDLLRGGAEGTAVVPFNAGSSKMLKLMHHTEEPHMPDHKPKLADADLKAVADWIDLGAPYEKPLVEGRKPSRDKSLVTADDKQWWAFQPLSNVAVPSGKAAHPVDAFLLKQASEKKLSFAAPANKRTLIRRAYLILTGLPPAPEKVEAFLNDRSPDAWDRLIDELLESPHYGERWARHWLDVARFAESSGFEHDYDRPHAYHFRDFVIKALNQDMPYDNFVRWQLAGDELAPDNALALTATGFLGAGVFPTQITANEVERTRYDAMDDMLSTTSSAFLGLTVGCARCHDHKYDPIPAKDYYRMLSTFTTTVRSEIKANLDPAKAKAEMDQWTAKQEQLNSALAKFETSLQPAFNQWIQQPTKATADTWAMLELKEIQSKGKMKFTPQSDGSWLASGKPASNEEYTIRASTNQSSLTGIKLEALAHPSMVHGGPGLANNGNFALSNIRVTVTPKGGKPTEVPLATAVADFEQNKTSLSVAGSIDNDPVSGWAVDPQFGKDHAAVFGFKSPIDLPQGGEIEVHLSFNNNTQHCIGRPRVSITSARNPSLNGEVIPQAIAGILARKSANLSAAEKKELFQWWKSSDPAWKAEQAKLVAHESSKPKPDTTIMICGEGHKPIRMHSQGADFFNETHFLKRGSTELKDGTAPQGFLQVLMPDADASKRWLTQPPAGAIYSGRRTSMAAWITDVEKGAGGLAARVMVNRLWMHHFGQGIVTTPNDFGKTGNVPSHPELLDWMAREFIRGGWKLKPMHKLLMKSLAWQQSSSVTAEQESADPPNHYFMRRQPHRLEGEAIRDSILSVSGLLDPTQFGAGTKNEKSKRRSIYFTMKRSQLIGSMVAFDQPEPLISQGSRPVTTVAPQALFLMNSSSVREWSAALAQRVKGATPIESIQKAYQLTLSRPATEQESSTAQAFLKAQTDGYQSEGKAPAAASELALTDFCQALIGLNEFVYLN